MIVAITMMKLFINGAFSAQRLTLSCLVDPWVPVQGQTLAFSSASLLIDKRRDHSRGGAGEQPLNPRRLASHAARGRPQKVQREPEKLKTLQKFSRFKKELGLASTPHHPSHRPHIPFSLTCAVLPCSSFVVKEAVRKVFPVQKLSFSSLFFSHTQSFQDVRSLRGRHWH